MLALRPGAETDDVRLRDIDEGGDAVRVTLRCELVGVTVREYGSEEVREGDPADFVMVTAPLTDDVLDAVRLQKPMVVVTETGSCDFVLFLYTGVAVPPAFETVLVWLRISCDGDADTVFGVVCVTRLMVRIDDELRVQDGVPIDLLVDSERVREGVCCDRDQVPDASRDTDACDRERDAEAMDVGECAVSDIDNVPLRLVTAAVAEL